MQHKKAKNMEENNKDQIGLAEALAVARGSKTPVTGDGDAKLLAFFLREGECNAEISDSIISVRYSWLRRLKPSHYFIQLAPGLLGRLMQLGRVQSITTEATFSVGPGSVNLGRRPIDFTKKWIHIQCEESRILIRVRDTLTAMNEVQLQYLEKSVLCERCKQELRTPLAKQCLHCGYDWH
jgi:hypothetical protein